MAFTVNDCLGHQQLTVDATAGGVSLTIPKGASSAFAQVTTAPIYFTLDATTPSSTNGHNAASGDSITLNSTLSKVRMIRNGGVSAVVNISYYRDAQS